MDALGLDTSYGAYLDRLPGVTLATVNLISPSGSPRMARRAGRPPGDVRDHFAGAEPPLRERRCGGSVFGDAIEFFDEHVEADSVHENIAAYDLAQGLARQRRLSSADPLRRGRSA